MFGGGGKKIKVPEELYDLMEQASNIEMATSVEEWAIKVLGDKASELVRAAGKKELSQDEVDDITKKLQGLGYLD